MPPYAAPSDTSEALPSGAAPASITVCSATSEIDESITQTGSWQLRKPAPRHCLHEHSWHQATATSSGAILRVQGDDREPEHEPLHQDEKRPTWVGMTGPRGVIVCEGLLGGHGVGCHRCLLPPCLGRMSIGLSRQDGLACALSAHTCSSWIRALTCGDLLSRHLSRMSRRQPLAAGPACGFEHRPGRAGSSRACPFVGMPWATERTDDVLLA